MRWGTWEVRPHRVPGRSVPKDLRTGGCTVVKNVLTLGRRGLTHQGKAQQEVTR